MMTPGFAEYLAVFADVVRAGSFSAASRLRAQTPSAVVRQIDALEQSLGTTLFIRSTRSLRLTDAGQKLYQRTLRLLDELADVHAEVSAFDIAVAGTLRIACLPSFGKRYVLPIIAALETEHPALRTELDLTERLYDPITERLDVMIRMGDLPDSTLIANTLAPLKRLLVASPAYLARAGIPVSVPDLARHRLIDKLHGADLLGWKDLPGFSAGAAESAEVFFRCDDFEALRSAALSAMGIAFLPTWMVGQDVQAGTLVRLNIEGECWNNTASCIHLLRSQPQPGAKVRVFIEALRQAVGSPPIWEP
jgi:DNA-binding transcriptional LysR family regulator